MLNRTNQEDNYYDVGYVVQLKGLVLLVENSLSAQTLTSLSKQRVRTSWQFPFSLTCEAHPLITTFTVSITR